MVPALYPSPCIDRELLLQPLCCCTSEGRRPCHFARVPAAPPRSGPRRPCCSLRCRHRAALRGLPLQLRTCRRRRRRRSAAACPCPLLLHCAWLPITRPPSKQSPRRRHLRSRQRVRAPWAGWASAPTAATRGMRAWRWPGAPTSWRRCRCALLLRLGQPAASLEGVALPCSRHWVRCAAVQPRPPPLPLSPPPPPPTCPPPPSALPTMPTHAVHGGLRL